MNKRRTFTWLLALFLSIALAGQSFGCPVCFGDSDAPIVKGVEMSVLFMVGITYSVILGGVAVFFLLRYRARQLRGPERIG